MALDLGQTACCERHWKDDTPCEAIMKYLVKQSPAVSSVLELAVSKRASKR